MIRAATSYLGAVPKAIHRFKYAGRKTLAPLFAVLLEQAWTHYPELRPVDVLVPVPLHPSNYRERGYNQALLLAEALAPQLHLPLLQENLVRIRKTKPQFRLQKTARQVNLDGAFGLHPHLSFGTFKGLHVLLIDDVCTTGATLKECLRVLRSAGAATVKALVVARDI